MKWTKLVWGIVRILLFVFGIYYLIAHIDPSDISGMFTNVAWPYLLFTFIAVLLTQLGRTFRFGYILKTLEIPERFGRLFWIQCIANFWSRLTPGKLGDLGKVGFLPEKKKTLPYAVLEKVVSLFAIFIVALPIVFIFERRVAIIILAVLFALALTVFILLLQQRFFLAFKRLLKRFIKKELPPRPRPKLIVILLLWSFVDWFLSLAAFYTVALALGYVLNPFLFLGAVAAAIAIGSVSGVPGGYGTREGALSLFLVQLLAVAPGDAVLIALYAIIIVTLSEFILFALGHLFERGKERGKHGS